MPKGIYPRTKNHSRNISLALKGRPKSEETLRNIIQANKKRIGIKMPVRSETHRRKISESNRKRVLLGTHNFWKGGITSESVRIRNSLEISLWRQAVFKRDDWICQNCRQRGGKLEADHIKPFSTHPELRFEITNGRTLCVECHKKTDTYKSKARKYAR